MGGTPKQHQGKQGTLACLRAFSPALAEIAKKYGFNSEETLTGFQHIGKAFILFGFEEALGYLLIQTKLTDKDGIAEAIVISNLKQNLEGKHQGM